MTAQGKGAPVLAPCPMCGRYNPRSWNKNHLAFYVDCRGCGLGTSAERCEADAIAAWNRRAPDPVRTELVEALRFFSFIGISENEDYRPQIRLPREAILAARAALKNAEAASPSEPEPS